MAQRGTTQKKMRSVSLRAQKGQVKMRPFIVGLAQNEALDPLGALETGNRHSLILGSTLLIRSINPNEIHENGTYH